MNYFFHLGFLLLCLGAPLVSYGDAVWISRLFLPSDGLAYQVVRDIAQTPDGEIWFATWGGGLSRFNGSRWETWNEKNHLSDYMTRCLAVDPQGGMWVGTAAGIRYYDGKKWTLYLKENTPTLQEDSVYTILLRRNGEIWIGLADGYLYSFDPRKETSSQWTLIQSPDYFKNTSIRALLETDDGSVWVGGNHFFHWNEKTWTEYPYPQRIFSLGQTKDGRLFAAGSENLLQWDGTTWQIVQEGGKEPRSLAVTDDDMIIVGTVRGVRICDEGIWSDLELTDDSPSPYVEGIRVLEDGSIWIGTRNGVYLVRRSDWSIYPLPQSHTKLVGKCFFTSPEVPPRIVTHEGEIYHFLNDRWILTGNRNIDEKAAAEVLFQDDDRILFQGNNELIQYDVNLLTVVRTLPLPAGLKRLKAFQTSDGVFWVHGYEGEGLLFWNGTSWESYHRKKGKVNERTQVIRETRDGTKWIVFPDSIETIGKEFSFLNFYTSLEFRGHQIVDVCMARNGWIWIATSGAGIYVYNGTDLKRFTTQDGLSNDWILCLYESADGTLWAGMEDSTVASFRDDRWIIYSKEEIRGVGHITRISEDPDGAMWFFLEPTSVVRYQPSPNPPDTAIDVFPKEIVPQGRGVFSFHGWDVWHMTRPEDLVFSWRVLDDRTGRIMMPWTPFQPVSIISSPPLYPGSYTFEVRSADKERNIDSSPARVPFRVEPYFFMKPVFWIPVVLFTILALILSAIVLKKHQKLRESERWLSQAQKIAHIGHWIVDFGCNRLIGSEETYRILGIDPKAFSGIYRAYLRIVHPDDMPSVRSLIRRAIQKSQQFTYDHRIVRPEGDIRTVRIQAEILLNDFGNPLLMMGTIQDITEKKRLEEEVQQVQKLEAIGVLAGGIAHDFNNLLTVVFGNIALAKRAVGVQHPVYQRLLDSETAMEKAQSLTRQLITFSESNKPIRKTCSIAEVVRNAVLSVVQSTSIQCSFHIPGDLQPVSIDKRQITQVIRNLTINAVQAMPNGGSIGIKLETIAVNGKSNVSLWPGDYLRISIEDNGCGIRPEHLPKIFDPYFTTQDNVTQKGLGLGLAICYAIVKQHQGHIDVESKWGQGTKVHIYLPASKETRTDN